MTEDSIQQQEPTTEVVSADEAPETGSPMSLSEYAWELYLVARRGRTTSLVEFALWCHPLTLVHYLICLDAFWGDHRYADENADKKMKGQKIVSWEAFERQRIARYKKLPPFLSTMTLLTVVAFMAQDAFEGWKNADTGLVTSRITEHKEWYRIFTSTFMHSGEVHLYENIIFMWVNGFFLELKYGSVLVGSIFTISALGGTLTSAIFTPYEGAIGISGGWLGLTGMAYVELWKHWPLLIYRHPMSVFCLVLEAFNLVFISLYLNDSGLLFGVGFSALFITSKGYPDTIFFDQFGGFPQPNLKGPTSLFVISLACFLKAIDFLWRSGTSEHLICPDCCQSYQLDTNGTAGSTSTRQLIELLDQIVCYGRDSQGPHCAFWEVFWAVLVTGYAAVVFIVVVIIAASCIKPK